MPVIPADIAGKAELTAEERDNFLQLTHYTWSLGEERLIENLTYAVAVKHWDFLTWLCTPERNDDPRVDAEFTALRDRNWGRAEEMAAEHREMTVAVQILIKLRELRS